MQETEANNIFYSATVLEEAIGWLKTELAEEDLEFRNRNSLFYDHDDGCAAWLGEVRNYRFDKETKQLIGDLWIVDRDCAEKMDYQIEQMDQRLWGISPRWVVAQDKETNAVTQVRPKSWALVLHPAGGKELMLEDETEEEDEELVYADLEEEDPETSILLKMDEEERYVLGIVLNPETPDAHGDTYSGKAIREGAHEFWLKYNTALIQHRDELGRMPDLRKEGAIQGYPGVQIVDSFVLPEAMIVMGRMLPADTWLVGSKVYNDEAWLNIKNGKLTGYSIGALGMHEPGCSCEKCAEVRQRR